MYILLNVCNRYNPVQCTYKRLIDSATSYVDLELPHRYAENFYSHYHAPKDRQKNKKKSNNDLEVT
jgi:hypothetical protein